MELRLAAAGRSSMNAPLIVFGEALVDCFSERLVVGGAPFNVARHLAGLGSPVLMITRLGRDPLARLVTAEFSRFGLSEHGLQWDTEASTGVVQVKEFKAGGHEFEILPDQSYDRIDAKEAIAAISHLSTRPLYHGTLAMRNATSREALLELYAHGCGADSFLDINWRDGQVDENKAATLVARAATLKLNEQELSLVGNWFGVAVGFPKQPLETGSNCAAVAELMQSLAATQLIVTFGAAGYAAFDRNGVCLASGAALEQPHLVDTVGAGDAFSAVVLVGRSRAWPLQTSLKRAAEFASAICGQRGAVPLAPDFYRDWRQQWTLSC